EWLGVVATTGRGSPRSRHLTRRCAQCTHPAQETRRWAARLRSSSAGSNARSSVSSSNICVRSRSCAPEPPKVVVPVYPPKSAPLVLMPLGTERTRSPNPVGTKASAAASHPSGTKGDPTRCVSRREEITGNGNESLHFPHTVVLG